MQKWIIITIAIVILAFGGLFYLGRSTQPTLIDGVGCLPNGHQNLYQHIHPTITIIEDENPVTIPGDIGNSVCMRWLHTHDTSGTIHLETPDARDLVLRQFFSVWKAEKGSTPLDGKTIANVTVDDQPYSGNYNDILLRDRQKIVITID